MAASLAAQPGSAAVAGPATAATERCNAPAGLMQLGSPLPRTAERLRAHERLGIVAIGSSSTEGVGASSPAQSYPSRLAVELERQLGNGRVIVHNKGIGGETAHEMIRRFERDVFALSPDLVIWQVGSNAVLRSADVDVYDRVIRDGLSRLRAAGVDVILMDMQYAPKILARPTHAAMEARLQTIGDALAVPVFHRYAIMHQWVEKQHLGFAALLSPDGLHMNDYSYGCIARLLADAIVERAGPSPLSLAPVASRY